MAMMRATGSANDEAAALRGRIAAALAIMEAGVEVAEVVIRNHSTGERTRSGQRVVPEESFGDFLARLHAALTGEGTTDV